MRLHGYIFLFQLAVLLCLAASAQTNAIDSLQQIVAQGKKDAVELSSLIKLSNEFMRVNVGKAKETIQASIVLARVQHSDIQLSAAYSQMVSLEMNTGNPDSALIYIDRLKDLASHSVNDTVKANYPFSAGNFYKKQGNYKAALPYMKRALVLYTKVNSRISMAGQALNIANTYLDMADIKQALPYHLQALKLFEELNNKRGQSYCQQGIANDFIKLEQYKAAIPYMEKAMVLKRELNDTRAIATTLSSFAQVYTGMGNHDKALTYALQALQLDQQLKIVPEESQVDFTIGKIYVAKRDVKAATSYFNKSKTLALQANDSSLAAAAVAELVNLQVTANQQKETEKKLFNSLQTSLETGDKFTEINSYKFLSNFYAANKQYDKALSYNEKFHLANDSTTNNELQLQVKKLEQQYNVEKKEKEIALLKKEQELRRAELEKERTIKAGGFILAGLLVVIGFLVVNRYRVIQKGKRLVEIEKLRNDIARDLHDDIGSALSSININSNMALSRSEEQAVVKSQLEKIKVNSGRIMESMGDIVWAINPGNDSIENLLIKMKEFLTEILEPLNINYKLKQTDDLKKIKLDVDKRKEIYLVFKEVVNNAAKYSRCKNIAVLLAGDGRQLKLEIADDGSGFDITTARQGNGLRNMRQRAVVIDGTLHVDTAIGRGTKVLLEVPVT